MQQETVPPGDEREPPPTEGACDGTAEEDEDEPPAVPRPAKQPRLARGRFGPRDTPTDPQLLGSLYRVRG